MMHEEKHILNIRKCYKPYLEHYIILVMHEHIIIIRPMNIYNY